MSDPVVPGSEGINDKVQELVEDFVDVDVPDDGEDGEEVKES